MQKKLATLVLAGLVLVMQGCSTGAYVMVPADTKLVIPAKGDQTYDSGFVKTRPFSWGQAGGISYQLKKNDAEVTSGKLPSKFRAASIFWPPVGIAYWPIGFRWPCYDLRGQVPAQCSQTDLDNLRKQARDKE
ncbi:hypothetical protein ACQV5M_19380 [Leptospira sp. SA-E8]|uniref:hypothetical protein n=1 Tax=Leptospira sp. SA-E8 TaxID=3422259 RepID=UPI003EB7255A